MTWPLIDWPALLTLISSSRATCTGVPFETARGIVGVTTGLASDVIAGAGLFVSTGFGTRAGAVSWASTHAADTQANKTAQRIRSRIISFPRGESSPVLDGVKDSAGTIRDILATVPSFTLIHH